MSSIVVYGFGSAFANAKTVNDVDLLILHENTGVASCRFAVQCKKQLADRLTQTHITMLSITEEKQFKFIHTSQAICLGTIREDNLFDDIAALYAAMLGFRIGLLSSSMPRSAVE